MSVQIPPIQDVPFRGIHTAGNPVSRPRGTASECSNLRVMPGGWLRIRGGRKARFNTTGGSVRKIHAFRQLDLPGSSNHLAQIKYSAVGPWTRAAGTLTSIVVASNVGTATTNLAHGLSVGQTFTIAGASVDTDLNKTYTITATPTDTTLQFTTVNVADGAYTESTLAITTTATSSRWILASVNSYPTISEYGVETISTTHDSAFANSNPVASCNLIDRPLFYNGLGVQVASPTAYTKPPFSTFTGGVSHYFGLDAYCPSSAPTVAWAGGTGNNAVATSVKIYVGLYNGATGHYSNGVYCGEITTQTGTGEITVSNLDRLVTGYHNAADKSYISYCFYASVDGYNVPYLIMDATGIVTYTAALGTTSASLSIVSGGNGWILDLTKEMPVNNYPPRPMRSIAYINGRLYGALISGGTGIYAPAYNELNSVVWSAAAGDVTDRDFLGDPLQSWPATNISRTPSGDQPIVVYPAQEGAMALVITPTSTFYLVEQADGIHEWITISRKHGIKAACTIAETPYGIVWLDQYNQIVMLQPGDDSNSRQIVILSKNYPGVTVGTPSCADYLMNDTHEIDRYQIWMTSGLSVIHDFRLRDDDFPYGQSYTATGQAYTAAASVMDAAGVTHHLVADGGFYTQEAQPEDNTIPSTDDTFTTGQTYTSADITGTRTSNWDDFGDSNTRKALPQIDIIGDGATSTALAVSPLTLEWYADFEYIGTKTFTADAAMDLLTCTGHQYSEGDELRFTTTGTLPAPLVAGTSYWARSISTNALAVSLTRTGPIVNITTAGSGTHSVQARKFGTLSKLTQSQTDSAYRWVLQTANRFWYKLKITIAGHSADDSTFTTLVSPSTQGGLLKNFYGSIMRVLYHVGTGGNRA